MTKPERYGHQDMYADLGAKVIKHSAGAASLANESDQGLLQAASALLDGVAYEIDRWFPDDAHPTIQTDLRTIAARLRERYGLRLFVPDEHGGHLDSHKPG